MNLVLAPSITPSIYFYIGWYELRKDNAISTIVWDKLCENFSQDNDFREKFKDYIAYQYGNNSTREIFLYFINYLLNQTIDVIPKILMSDKDFVRLYTKHHRVENIEFIAEHLRSDKEIMANIVSFHGDLNFVGDELKSNEEFLLTAIKCNYDVFWDLDENLKSDRRFVLKAIEQDHGVYDGASESLRSDKSFVIEAININYKIIGLTSLWRMYPDLIVNVVENNPKALEYSLEGCEEDSSARKFFNKFY